MSTTLQGNSLLVTWSLQSFQATCLEWSEVCDLRGHWSAALTSECEDRGYREQGFTGIAMAGSRYYTSLSEHRIIAAIELKFTNSKFGY